MRRPKLRSFSIGLPFNLGTAELELSDLEIRVAWSLYVEFSTRVAVALLDPGAGSARESLDSLYSLFATTREVLREAGPDVGRGPSSLGAVAIRVLNDGLRPFVVRWHTELTRFELAHGGGEAESSWDGRAEFDAALAAVRADLAAYVQNMGRIAGVRE